MCVDCALLCTECIKMHHFNNEMATVSWKEAQSIPYSPEYVEGLSVPQSTPTLPISSIADNVRFEILKLIFLL